MHSWSFVALALALGANAAPRIWSSGQAVETTQGVIKGHSSSRAPGVSEYLGIPFAEPPVGPLRFQRPHRYRVKGPITADKFGPDCASKIQGTTNTTGIFAVLAQQGDEFSEDCLTLNIWTKPQTGERDKAVLVWIYGGGFTSGTSSSPSYRGARLADEQDVVVVTFNYRLGIFGFPGAPGIPDANLGLLDQRKAIEWVRDNIASFGGDPKRITIFGESAGGASVDMYSYAWLDDPIVSGFIAQSGTANLKGIVGGNSTTAWYRVARKLGCGGSFAGASTVDCVRRRPWKAVLAAISSGTGSSAILSPFMPQPDEKVVFSDYEARAKAGKFVRRPLLVGSNNNEAGLFSLIDMASGVKASAESNFRINLGFTCAAAQAARIRRGFGVKAWRYRYFGVWPNSNLGPGVGAYHGSEIPMVFGNSELVSDKKDVPNQSQLSNVMMKAWAEFAKNPEKGLTSLGWPMYDQQRETLVRLGYRDEAYASFAGNHEYDQNCKLWAEQGPLPAPPISPQDAAFDAMPPLPGEPGFTPPGAPVATIDNGSGSFPDSDTDVSSRQPVWGPPPSDASSNTATTTITGSNSGTVTNANGAAAAGGPVPSRTQPN